MEVLNFLQPFHLPIDIVMIILVIMAGQFQKKYFEGVKMNGALLTLIVSFVFCVLYATFFAFAYGFKNDLLLKWFFSYVTGTSLYELLLHHFLKSTDKL